jgi:hypothetical protein
VRYFETVHLEAFAALADAFDAALAAADDALGYIPEEQADDAAAERVRHVFNLIKSAEFAVAQVIEETGAQ